LRQGRERQQCAHRSERDQSRCARKSGWPISSNESESIHIFTSVALSRRFYHTPRVLHRTNTRWSSEACRSGIACTRNLMQRDAAFVRGAKDRYHRRDPSAVGKMARSRASNANQE
jgi:hypothetical protein